MLDHQSKTDNTFHVDLYITHPTNLLDAILFERYSSPKRMTNRIEQMKYMLGIDKFFVTSLD
jgi:hypothetical protein